MATNVIELLGLTPSCTGTNGLVHIGSYDLETCIQNYKIYIAVDTDERWHFINVLNKWTDVLIIKIVCYNASLFIEQIKSIEKELNIKLIKEDGHN